MMRRSKLIGSARRALLTMTAAVTPLLAFGAHAQSLPSIPGPPIFPSVDPNGVNIADGTFKPSQELAGIGPNSRLQQVFTGVFYESNVTGVINTSAGSICGGGGCVSATMYKVSLDGGSAVFAKPLSGNPGGLISSAYFNSRGQSLTYNSSTQVYTHIDRDGTTNLFSAALGSSTGWVGVAAVTSRQFPDGEVWTYNWISCGSGCDRLSSIKSNKGYMLKYDYTNYPSAGLGTGYFTSVTAINTSVDYCNPTASTCSYSKTWPSSTISYTGTSAITAFSITDELNRTTQYTQATDGITSITSPQGVSVSVSYGTDGKVSSITRAGVTYTYTWGTTYTRVYAPDGYYVEYTVNRNSGEVSAIKDRGGNVTSQTRDAYGFTSNTAQPEGNGEEFTRDLMGNVTTYKEKPKSGSGLSDRTITQVFPSCSVPAPSCNRASSYTDANGKTTDITYHTQTGNVATVTRPAPTTGAVRPEFRTSYGQVDTYEKNSSGSLVQAGSIWVPTGTSTCNTTSSCSSGADETKTVISYTGSKNALPTSVTEKAGDNSISRTTATTYNDLGLPVSVDGPLSGTADTVAYKYDNGGQLVGTIGPDPDGSGSLPHRAQRITYNSDGQVTVAETGTTAGQDATSWAAFSPLEAVTSTYDSNGRKTKDVHSAGSTSYSVDQYSYDSLGRIDCEALRMNPTIYSTLPTNTCLVGTAGSYGADRINKTVYDVVGHVYKTQSAVDTSDAVDEATMTYSTNGQLSTITDGEGNTTTYTYDGFDRLARTSYPSTTKGAGTSSTTDYEHLSYDANGNVTIRYLRGYAGDSTKYIAYAYDALDRMTYKDLPGSEPDVAYAYDNLGRPTTITDAASNYAGYAYDALGRATAQSSPLGVIGMGYDVANRRTLTVWPDSFYVNYDYLVTGEVSAVRENGATSGAGVLATYTYDSAGRRTGMTRGNGTTTSYGYDAVSRLNSLSHDVFGTSNDVSTTFTHTPAWEIRSLVRNNDNYAWGAHANAAKLHVSNGLNQYTSVTGGSLGYDARGNLNVNGSSNYSYTSENMLVSAPSSVSLSYDPLLRLYQTVGTTTTRFLYDGKQMVAEYDASGNVLRRYVPGAGVDAPLVWYEGSGTSDRRWLHADERGSVVAVTGSSSVLGLNSYDEFGVPASGNIGRYQYTGQAYIPEIGMYNFKARIYSSRLGRFLQSDPIGYSDGMNLYNYVGGDAVNLVDPSGLCGGVGDDAAVPCEPGITVTGDRKTYCQANPFDCYVATLSGTPYNGTFNFNARPPINVVPNRGGGGTVAKPKPTGPKRTARKTKKSGRPDYCNSAGFLIGELLDGGGQGTADLGLVMVFAGGAQWAAAPVTGGVSAATGTATAAGGADMMLTGAAMQFTGKYMKSAASNADPYYATDYALNGLSLGSLLVRGGKIAKAISSYAGGKAVEMQGSAPCQR